MKIRRTTPEDHDALLDIWLRSVRATHTFLTEEDIQFYLPMVRDYALRNPDLWVLVTDRGTPIGFMGMIGNKVETLFIAPKFLRRGGGRLLIAHARTLKGALRVDVNEQNPAAREFYESQGFGVVGRSKVDATGRNFPLLHMHQLAPAKSPAAQEADAEPPARDSLTP